MTVWMQNKADVTGLPIDIPADRDQIYKQLYPVLKSISHQLYDQFRT